MKALWNVPQRHWGGLGGTRTFDCTADIAKPGTWSNPNQVYGGLQLRHELVLDIRDAAFWGSHWLNGATWELRTEGHSKWAGVSAHCPYINIHICVSGLWNHSQTLFINVIYLNSNIFTSLGFWDKILLCSLVWPQTLNCPASPFQVWYYGHSHHILNYQFPFLVLSGVVF